MKSGWICQMPAAISTWLADKTPMRSLNDAGVRVSSSPDSDIELIIDHPPLIDTSLSMMEWWNRYFYYLQLQSPAGQLLTAYRLWHPEQHVDAWIHRHAPSGEIGAVSGAWTSLVNKNKVAGKTLTHIRVISLDHNRCTQLLYQAGEPVARLVETYRKSPAGLQCQTQLQVVCLPAVKNNTSEPHATLSILTNDWARLRVQQLGNLAIILPPLFINEGGSQFPRQSMRDSRIVST